MQDSNPYEKYREQAVSTQTPGELIILLYDRALFHINAASRHIEHKRPGDAHASIRKAQDIVLYLQGILDPRYPVSGILKQYYSVILRQLSRANIHKDLKDLSDAAQAMRTLRDTWKQLETQNHAVAPIRRESV